MTKDYYKKKIIIARCDRKGNILGPIERWEAHEKAILHRAFSVVIFYKGKYLVQHRKHPVFDGVLDVSSSSHQVYSNGQLQDTIEAVYECLEREWNLTKKDLSKQPEDMGTVYYKARDKFSIYSEHEVCNVVVCETKKLPPLVEDVSYGYSLFTKKDLSNARFAPLLAPWVQAMIKQKKI